MQIEKIKIIEDEEAKEINISELNKSVSPFKEILSKKDYTYYSLSINGKDIDLEETYHLLVNIKGVGDFNFFYNLDNFNQDEVINKIVDLKNMEVDSKDSAIAKIKALIEIADKYNPLFLVYKQNGDFFLSLEELDALVSYPLFYFEKEIEQGKKKNKEVEEEEAPNQKEEGSIGKTKRFFSLIIEERFYVGFAMIAAFLIEIATSIGFNYSYAGNYIAAFFFVCALLGTGLMAVIFKDVFRKYKVISAMSIAILCSYIVGLGIGFGGYVVFADVQKEKPASIMSLPKLFLVTFGISVGLLVFSLLVALLIRFLADKFGKKPEQ